jgi:hypothetical protein
MKSVRFTSVTSSFRARALNASLAAMGIACLMIATTTQAAPRSEMVTPAYQACTPPKAAAKNSAPEAERGVAASRPAPASQTVATTPCPTKTAS